MVNYLKLEDAKLQLGQAEAIYVAFCNEHGPVVPAPNTPARDELDKLRQVWTILGQVFAADPELRQEMRPWVLDVYGNGGEAPAVQEDLKDIPAFVSRCGGALHASILATAAEHGFGKPQEYGGGLVGWHVGWMLQESGVDKLSGVFRKQFDAAFRSNLLVLRMKFAGWRF